MLKLPRLGMILHSRLSHLATLLLGGTSVCSLMVHLSGGSAWNRSERFIKRQARGTCSGDHKDPSFFKRNAPQIGRRNDGSLWPPLRAVRGGACAPPLRSDGILRFRTDFEADDMRKMPQSQEFR